MSRETFYRCDVDKTAEATHIEQPLMVDGARLLIDLCDKCKADLDDVMAPYVAAARRSSAPSNVSQIGTARRRRNSRAAGGRNRDDNRAIREWANRWGLQVSERGRIPEGLAEAYRGRDEVTGEPAGNETWPRVIAKAEKSENNSPAAPAAEPPAEPESPKSPQLVKAVRADDKADYMAHQRKWREDKGITKRGSLSKANIRAFEEETGILPPLAAG